MRNKSWEINLGRLILEKLNLDGMVWEMSLEKEIKSWEMNLEVNKPWEIMSWLAISWELKFLRIILGK